MRWDGERGYNRVPMNESQRKLGQKESSCLLQIGNGFFDGFALCGGARLWIERDKAAVIAGLTLPWSQGPVEGHVNRLKLIKRQMFGRAKIDLLRQRVIHRV